MEFKFRGKKYKWTCTVWQAIVLAVMCAAGITSWVWLLGSVPV